MLTVSCIALLPICVYCSSTWEPWWWSLVLLR